MTDNRYTEINTAADITPEMEEVFADYAQSWPEATVLDLIERFESGSLADGSYPDFGPVNNSPAIRKVRKIVKEARAN